MPISAQIVFGMWSTFQGKICEANPTRCALVHTPCALTNLSRDTSGFVCGLFGTCELLFDLRFMLT